MTKPPRDLTVIRVGTDTSGRAIWFTRWAWSVWQAVLATPEVRPFAWKIVIVQGAFMLRNGGGAVDSAGVHNLAACWDIRTWNLTKAEIDILIKALRKAAIAGWRRDKSALHGGMDEHIHVTFGDDAPHSSGSLASWQGYVRGTNGLANGARDYEWRPSPLVLTPPASLFKEDYMASEDAAKQLKDIIARLERVETLLDSAANLDQRRWTAERERDRAERQAQRERYADLVTKIGGLADQFSGAERQAVLALLAAEPDVTGVDNPTPKEEA